MSAVRNFDVDLAMSDRPEVVAAIKIACHRQFPELLNVTKAHKMNDMIGVDYWLEFPGGRMEALDAKVRRLDYSKPAPGRICDDRTACLELVANVGIGKTGWTLDPAKRTDWILFFYIESGRPFFYHARQLRAAVVAYLPELKKTGQASTQRTGRYESTSLFVRHRDLSAAIFHHGHGNDDMALAA